MEVEEIKVGRRKLLDFDAEEIFFYGVAAKLGISFPVYRVYIKMKQVLILVRKVVEVVNRFI